MDQGLGDTGSVVDQGLAGRHGISMESRRRQTLGDLRKKCRCLSIALIILTISIVPFTLLRLKATPLRVQLESNVNPRGVQLGGNVKPRGGHLVAELNSTRTPRRHLLYHSPNRGRFGNVLFEFASIYGLARTTNHEPAFSSNTLIPLKQVFTLDFIPRTIPRGTRVVKEKSFGRFIPDNLPGSVANTSDVVVNGFLQVPRYFSAYDEDLRRILKIRPDLLEKAQLMLNTAIRGHFSKHKALTPWVNTTYVALHVRLGDKIRHPIFYVASKSYVVKAMRYFTDRYNNVLFIACSDTQAWLEKSFAEYPNVLILPATKDFRIHFTALTLCNHTIMTVGSFSFWVAWFVKGTTIYYERQFKETSTQYKMANTSDMFLPHWIRMGD